MNVKLNPRQCRAIVALADSPLPHERLEVTIGRYATNTIKSLAAKGFITRTIGVIQLSDAGRAMAAALEPTKHRHPPAQHGAHA